MEIRPFAPRDAAALWAAKRGFELGLGTGTGGDEKASKYEGKLDDDYREQWLAWVERCVEEDERCVTVAVEVSSATASGSATGRGESGKARGATGAAATGDSTPEDALAGYAFVLPESHRFVWDAAVLNEIYVAPAHRGTGVADDLMDAGVAVARDQDLPLDRLVLDVDRENDRAKAFYDRHGFDHWGEMVAREL